MTRLTLFFGGGFLRGFIHHTAALDPDSADPMMRPFTLEGDLLDAADLIKRWASSQPRWTVVDDEGPPEKIHLIRVTRVFRFIDDIDITLSLSGQDNQVIVNATSQSRVGKGDLGQNARNLRALVQGLG